MIKCVRDSNTRRLCDWGWCPTRHYFSRVRGQPNKSRCKSSVIVHQNNPSERCQGHLFVWNPCENVPYLVPPKELRRCKINVPRNARINASRVVEYVPQYDEVVKPKLAELSTHLWPIKAAAISAVEDDVVSLCDDSCQASDEGELD